MADTNIEWLRGDDGRQGKTWNPTDGCDEVSPGCSRCYAKLLAARFCGEGQPYAGLVQIVKGKAGRVVNWTGVVRFSPKKLALPLKWRKPQRVFVNSMSDLFHDGCTDQQIAAVFGVMAACSQHMFVVLTKRPRRMREWFEWLETQRTPLITIPWSPRLTCRAEAGKLLDVRGYHPMLGTEPSPHMWPLPNVILGVSVENRAVLERIDDLRACPAAARVISAEPLLEDLGEVDLSGVGWLIAGCESGPGARPCEVKWLRSLRDQCKAAEVAYFLKQAKETQLGVCGDADNPNGDKPCGKRVTAYVISDDTAAYSCGCTSEGSELGAGVALGAGEGSKRKPGGIIGLPYLDGVQHLAFPEAARG